MKIHEFYRDTANVHLNASIIALVPPMLIVIGNLSFFQSRQIMILTIPFVIYSIISYQIYLFRKKQSISIEKHIPIEISSSESLFESRHLVVVFMNTFSAKVYLYFPTGHLAGTIRKYRTKGLNGWRKRTIFALHSRDNQVIAFYKVISKRLTRIEVYNPKKEYLGCFEKEKGSLQKSKKSLLGEKGATVGVVEGSRYFMDEQVFNQSSQPVGRLRRGWMPVEWRHIFPEPNTPVLSLTDDSEDKDKLLRMSLLINEYFIER
jgi:hypothetical protein